MRGEQAYARPVGRMTAGDGGELHALLARLGEACEQ